MDNPITNTPPSPAVTPIATAAPVVQTAAPVVQQAAPVQFPQQQSPQTGNKNIKDILKSLNLTEMCFGILGAATLYYVIYYYKFNITAKKGFINDIENKMDELTIKVADVSSAMERDVVSSSPNNAMFV